METSLISTSACIVWKGFPLGWAQELGESQHSSWLSRSLFVLPGSWCGWLSLHLAAFLFSQPLVPEQVLFSPLDMTGQNCAPSGFADCFTTCRPSWLQLWHLHQPCCSHQSTLARTVNHAQETLQHGHHHHHRRYNSPERPEAHTQLFSVSLQDFGDFFPFNNVFWPLDHKKLLRDGRGLVCQLRAEVRSKMWPDRTFITFFLSTRHHASSCHLR